MITTTFTAKEAKNNFGRLLDEARHSPVAVERNGKPIAVVMSTQEYEEFEARRDAYWGERAKQAEKKGYIGTVKGGKLLREG